MPRTLALLALLSLAAHFAFAQAPPPAFEVASVKLAPQGAGRVDFVVQPGGKLEVTNQTLCVILMQAYSVKKYQIVGGPPWLDTDRFHIVATPPAQTNPDREHVMAMLRSLLAERFQLKLHTESREGDVFALTVAKSGPKLNPPEGDRPFIGLSRLTPPELPGVKYALETKRASMALFADHLSGELRCPVFNRTALDGEFSFRVEYSIDDNPDTGPAISEALREQLGLKLEKTKGPIETLVIDSAAKPSAD